MNLSLSRQEILQFAPTRWNVFESGHPQSIGSIVNMSKMQGVTNSCTTEDYLWKFQIFKSKPIDEKHKPYLTNLSPLYLIYC